MSKRRRFRVESLAARQTGDVFPLSPDESKHARVLRLQAETLIDLHDAVGLQASARWLDNPAGEVRIETVQSAEQLGESRGRRLEIGVAWPKGKRAAWLVEKCTELGVDAIQPIRYGFSVVHKDDESEGVQRLHRIAAEAAKQCGRNDLPIIYGEYALCDVLSQAAENKQVILLDPVGLVSLGQVLTPASNALDNRPVLLLIGPEGGFTAEELALVERLQIPRAKMAKYVLRIETAAVAAVAVARAALESAEENATSIK